MADSLSRWAEALREIGSLLQRDARRGGVPHLARQSARQALRARGARPRAGRRRQGRRGDLISAVSPPGGDFSEPVTQAALRVAGALWALDASLAHQRQFPAVDWETSYSLHAARRRALVRGARGLGLGRAAPRDAARCCSGTANSARSPASSGPTRWRTSDRLMLETARLLRGVAHRAERVRSCRCQLPPSPRPGRSRDTILRFHRGGATSALSGGATMAAIDVAAACAASLSARARVAGRDHAMSADRRAPTPAPTRRRDRCSDVSAMPTRAVLGEWVRMRHAGAAGTARPGDRCEPRRDGGPGLRGHRRAGSLRRGRHADRRHRPAVVGDELLGRVLAGAGAPLDGLPAPVGEALRPAWARAASIPSVAASPRDFIETGISAIDGMNTLVRGQKLPVFSGAGLPGLELAASIVEHARAPHGEPFAVVFAAIGITERETRSFLEAVRGQRRARAQRALPQPGAGPARSSGCWRRAWHWRCAEYLAFERGMQVLVVMADITHYCEALREIGAAREEMPGRRGYPGYMYTDLASIFERAGVVRGSDGSITQLADPHDAGRRHHASDSRPDRLHHRRADRAQPGTAPARRVPADRRAAVAVAADEGGHRRGHGARASPLGRPAVRGVRAGPRGTADGGHRRRVRAAARRPPGAGVHGAVREGVHRPGRRAAHHRETLEIGWALLETLPREDLHRIPEEAWARRAGRGGAS